MLSELYQILKQDTRTQLWFSPCKRVLLICDDCMKILPQIPAGVVDAVVTDPPYGIGASGGVGKYGVQKWGGDRDLKWDVQPIGKDAISMLIECSKQQIIWGMNYFPLPPSRMYLVWDKGNGFRGRTFSECELAWCSMDGNARVFNRDPLACRDYVGKQHPTQKPVALMYWCCELVGGEIIMDLFMGVASTGIAAIRLGRSFIGIEIEPKYFEIAKDRIEAELNQPQLFDVPEPQVEQDSLFQGNG